MSTGRSAEAAASGRGPPAASGGGWRGTAVHPARVGRLRLRPRPASLAARVKPARGRTPPGPQSFLPQTPLRDPMPKDTMATEPTKKDGPLLTTADGAPIPDQENAMTAGPRGPVLMQDVVLQEQIQRFNRERVPERAVHAKGFRGLRHVHGHPRHHRVHPSGHLLGGRQSRPSASPGSRPSPASAARPTPSATRAGSRSSSTPRRATGTWWATTRPSSLCATRTSSRCSSTRRSGTRTRTCATPTCSGTSGACAPSRSTRSRGCSATAASPRRTAT